MLTQNERKISMIKKIIYTTLMTVVMGSITNAASQQIYCKVDEKLSTIKSCKNIPSNRRNELGALVSGGNPVAITNDKGNLFVWYTVGGSKLKGCQVTNNVEEFKMSSNPKDLSTAYFIRDKHMFDVKMSGSVSAEECPKATKQDYNTSLGLSGDAIKDLKVVPNGNSQIVAVGETESGFLILSYDQRIEKRFVGRNAGKALDSIIQGKN